MQSVLTTRKQPSQELQDLISKVSNAFGKLQDTVNMVLEKGREEGFSDKELGDMIREKMTIAGYSRMTMSRYLPASAKHMEKSSQSQRNKMLRSGSENRTKPLQFVGKISKASKNRHSIMIPASIDVSRFEGKQITVMIKIDE